MYREGIIPTKSGAAVVAEMKQTTIGHRTRGRRSAEDNHKSRRLLKEEEDEFCYGSMESFNVLDFR